MPRNPLPDMTGEKTKKETAGYDFLCRFFFSMAIITQDAAKNKTGSVRRTMLDCQNITVTDSGFTGTAKGHGCKADGRRGNRDDGGAAVGKSI